MYSYTNYRNSFEVLYNYSPEFFDSLKYSEHSEYSEYSKYSKHFKRVENVESVRLSPEYVFKK